MDYRTKYYRPDLAKGTAGAAETTPTPIRRSATKWAMPVDGGGSGGDYPIMDIKVAGTNADEINAALAEYLPMEAPQSAEPQSINIELKNVDIGTTYAVTGTPGADWFMMVGDVEPTGKGEPVTANVTGRNNILAFTIMAATKEDGSDMKAWTFTITGGGK